MTDRAAAAGRAAWLVTAGLWAGSAAAVLAADLLAPAPPDDPGAAEPVEPADAAPTTAAPPSFVATEARAAARPSLAATRPPAPGLVPARAPRRVVVVRRSRAS